MLGKKMNARSDNGTASSRKNYFLEDGTKGKRQGGRRCGCEEEREESCRWDRTDSECKSLATHIPSYMQYSDTVLYLKTLSFSCAVIVLEI